jgi:hypothetical protein
MMATIRAYLTCTRVKWEDENPDPLQEDGWVDLSWNPYQLRDHQDDVRPVMDCDESDPYELSEETRKALDTLPGGYADNGDGTFYARDTYQPLYGDGWDYAYALHFSRDDTPWHPVTDGHLEL